MYSVSQKNPPCGFLTIFQNGWEFLISILHTHYKFLSTLEYKFFIQLSPTLMKLCHNDHRPPSECLHFTATLTSKFAYWANDAIVDVMSYPTCLVTL